eukprot:COSAG06_NODE_32135_length_510_cov_3.929440_1_plen_29_part_01
MEWCGAVTFVEVVVRVDHNIIILNPVPRV